jgi:hypothetical protein
MPPGWLITFGTLAGVGHEGLIVGAADTWSAASLTLRPEDETLKLFGPTRAQLERFG